MTQFLLYRLGFMAGTETENKIGLLRINPDTSNIRGDVIFVHGLNGHPIMTWHPQEMDNQECWPYWLAQSEPHIGIWSYGYNAPLWRTQAQTLFDLGGKLLNELTPYNMGQQQRPVIFITHSLGGLVVKKMLEFAMRYQNQARVKALTSQTRGIVFLATPHLGSDLVNDPLLKIARHVTGDNINANELQSHAHSLRDLNNWYRQNVCEPIHSESSANTLRLKIATRSYYETEKTRILGFVKNDLVVYPDSADLGIPDSLCTGVDGADHISIAKPSKDSTLFISVQQYIQDILPNPQ
jgi:protein SERAC1